MTSPKTNPNDRSVEVSPTNNVDLEANSSVSEKPDSAPAEETEVSSTPNLQPQKRSFKLTKPTAIGGLLLLAGLVGFGALKLLGNAENVPEAVATLPEETARPVAAVKAESAPIQEWVFGDGYVTAVKKKHLTFEAEGTITYIKKVGGRELREGDRVRAGELLATIDRRKAAADVTVASASRTEAKSQLTSALADRQKAKESLAQANADRKQAQTNLEFAQADLKRYQELLKEGAIERREVEVREKELKNARAQLEAAQAQVRSARSGVAASETQVQAAEAGVNSASAQLAKTAVNVEDTEIRAPFNGIIAHLNITEGDYWTPQRVQASADYQSILERIPMVVADADEYEVQVELPAYQGNQVRPGQRAFIVLDQDQKANLAEQVAQSNLIQLAKARGRVFSVSPAVSPGQRAVTVKIRISDGTTNLQDGARVAAWIAVQEKTNATVVPYSALVFRDQKPHIFVVTEVEGRQVVEQRAIVPGIEGLSQREILQGVKPGELLVTEGKSRLVDGAPVEVIED